ncbi:hypothetical protein H5410_053347 [Solanum commersonii]|uniref:Uncharacterized protein n=1 Tax=Solanum commersonii TaxID=4109 RepID=A0A9J5X6U6_SOLCO|nr:hypothetical protein H5410_053347 [Solanum commersonii]
MQFNDAMQEEDVEVRLDTQVREDVDVGRRSIGKKVIRQDMTQIQVTENMTLNMRVWRTRTRIEASAATPPPWSAVPYVEYQNAKKIKNDVNVDKDTIRVHVDEFNKDFHFYLGF